MIFSYVLLLDGRAEPRTTVLSAVTSMHDAEGIRNRSLLPGVNDRYAGRFKIGYVPGHDCHAMNDRGGSDHCVSFGTWGWNMQCGASLGDRRIDREYVVPHRLRRGANVRREKP
jgi:hypothetical protein